MSQDTFIIRRVMDRLLGRQPVTKSTRLFSTKEAAEKARDLELTRRATAGIPGVLYRQSSDFTQVRKYSGGCWGFDDEE